MKHHGSENIMEGKLTGATDHTDYFYLFCPACPDKTILKMLDYEIQKDVEGNAHDKDSKHKSGKSFTIAFSFACETCGLKDVFKVSNIGWQGGPHADTLL